MKITFSRSFNLDRLTKIASFSLSIIFVCGIFASASFAQKKKPRVKKAVAKKSAPKKLPKVTQIDQAGLANLLKREGENAKPLLINFWATWCDPCREEFPELVKIDTEYKGKIDFITITLDDPKDINTAVPKFLAGMKATMPAYLLKTPDEEAAIVSVAKDWQGGLPFTILFDSKGKQAYFRQGKVTAEGLKKEIEKFTVWDTASDQADTQNSFPPREVKKAEAGKTEAEADIAKGTLIIKRYGLTAAVPEKQLKELKSRYKIEVTEHGCVLLGVSPEYFSAYNEVMKQEIERRYGQKALKLLPL